jgi:hypothetical protein
MKSYRLSEHYSINTFSMLYKPQAVLWDPKPEMRREVQHHLLHTLTF